MTKSLVVASADSHIKWCWFAAQQITPEAQIDIYAPVDNFHIDSTILSNMGVVAPVSQGPLDELCQRIDLSHYETIICILTPSKFVLMHQMIEDWVKVTAPRARPIIITGFPGITMRLNNVLLARLGADIICLNSRRDLDEATHIVESLGEDPNVLTSSGYPFSAKHTKSDFKRQPNTGRTILFSTQPHWPGRLMERLYILEKLYLFAIENPCDKVLIKLRMPPGKKSIHAEKYHYEEIFAFLGKRSPDNLIFAYGEMQSALATADLHLTLSSTAAAESIAMGIPTAIIADFGIDEGYGVNHFIGSGLIMPIAEALTQPVPSPSHRWLQRNGFHPDDNLSAAAMKTRDLLAEQARLGTAIPMRKSFFNPRNRAYAFHPQPYLPPLVRRGRQAWKQTKRFLPPILSEILESSYRSIKRGNRRLIRARSTLASLGIVRPYGVNEEEKESN